MGGDYVIRVPPSSLILVFNVFLRLRMSILAQRVQKKDTVYEAKTDTSLDIEATRAKFDLAFLQDGEN